MVTLHKAYNVYLTVHLPLHNVPRSAAISQHKVLRGGSSLPASCLVEWSFHHSDHLKVPAVSGKWSVIFCITIKLPLKNMSYLFLSYILVLYLKIILHFLGVFFLSCKIVAEKSK